MIQVAGIVRKSPTKKNVEENIQVQIDAIESWCIRKYGKNNYKLELFIDKNVSGDDPSRPQLINLFQRINEFDCAVAHVVDRYVRHHMGLTWFFEYFTENEGRSPHKGCRLSFVEGLSDLYNDNGTLNADSFFMLYIHIGIAHKELLNIRVRTDRGRDRLSGEQWKQKFKGRKQGARNSETDEAIKKLKMYIQKGYTVPTIAKKMGKSVHQINYLKKIMRK